MIGIWHCIVLIVNYIENNTENKWGDINDTLTIRTTWPGVVHIRNSQVHLSSHAYMHSV